MASEKYSQVRFSLMRARGNSREPGVPCLFLNTERGFGGKPPKKSRFRRHLAGSKMPKETFFTAILRWRVVAARARCLGFLAGVAAVSRPRSSATSPFPPGPVAGAARRWRAPESRAGRAPTLLRCLAPATSKRSPLAATNVVCISGIQHIDLIRQYRGAGIDQLINGDRNDGETRELFASDVMLHFA